MGRRGRNPPRRENRGDVALSTPYSLPWRNRSLFDQVEAAEAAKAAQDALRDSMRGQVDTAKLIRKIDFRLIPILWLLFLCAFIDRINIGNARIQGLEEDLGMVGSDYNM